MMTRQQINNEYKIILTDNQWAILKEEVEGRDDGETEAEVIEDVCNNLESYEQEHAWWNSLKF